MKLERKYLLLFVLLVFSSLSFSASRGILSRLECPSDLVVQTLRGSISQNVPVIFPSQGRGTLQCDNPEIPLTKLVRVVFYGSVGNIGFIQCIYIGESAAGQSICDLRLDGPFEILPVDPRLDNFLPSGWQHSQCYSNSPAACPFVRPL